MRIFSVVLSIIAFICALYNFVKANKLIKKLDEMDNAIFQFMMDDHNEKVRTEN